MTGSVGGRRRAYPPPSRHGWRAGPGGSPSRSPSVTVGWSQRFGAIGGAEGAGGATSAARRRRSRSFIETIRHRYRSSRRRGRKRCLWRRPLHALRSRSSIGPGGEPSLPVTRVPAPRARARRQSARAARCSALVGASGGDLPRPLTEVVDPSAPVAPEPCCRVLTAVGLPCRGSLPAWKPPGSVLAQPPRGANAGGCHGLAARKPSTGRPVGGFLLTRGEASGGRAGRCPVGPGRKALPPGVASCSLKSFRVSRHRSNQRLQRKKTSPESRLAG